MAIRSFRSSDSAPSENYRRLVSLVVPRPIAWVSTIDAVGLTNLAPFSFFNGVSSDPPCLSVSIARNPDGSKKDTLRNIEASGEFVVNSAHEWLAEKINASSASLPASESEFDLVGVGTLPSEIVRPPRVRECLASFECVTERLVEIGGETPGAATLVIGRIVCTHVDESLFDARDRIDPEKLAPASRWGGMTWGRGGELYTLVRPRTEET